MQTYLSWEVCNVKNKATDPNPIDSFGGMQTCNENNETMDNENA